MTVATQVTTFDDAKARREVGYEATVSRASGLAELEVAADVT